MIGMSRSTGRSISDAATHFTHLRQSIHDILTTLIGTRICRRYYGSLVPNLIDAPMNEATGVRLSSSIASALIRCEPRIKLSKVKTVAISEGIWDVEVHGTVIVNQQVHSIKEQYQLGAAA